MRRRRGKHSILPFSWLPKVHFPPDAFGYGLRYHGSHTRNCTVQFSEGLHGVYPAISQLYNFCDAKNHSFLRPTMSSQAVDEETPLLQAQKQKTGRTPLPWRQFSIIMFLQLSEPLTSQGIAPFAPQVCPCLLPPCTFSFILPSFQADTGHWHYERRRNKSWILCGIAGASS